MGDMVKVSAIQCPTCRDVIFSRAHYDFHYCSCGEVAIDGGRDYTRVAFKDIRPTQIILVIPQSADELYKDWNTKKDKLGIIRTKKSFAKIKDPIFKLTKRGFSQFPKELLPQ